MQFPTESDTLVLPPQPKNTPRSTTRLPFDTEAKIFSNLNFKIKETSIKYKE